LISFGIQPYLQRSEPPILRLGQPWNFLPQLQKLSRIPRYQLSIVVAYENGLYPDVAARMKDSEKARVTVGDTEGDFILVIILVRYISMPAGLSQAALFQVKMQVTFISLFFFAVGKSTAFFL
jgi:hypothetical protein